MVPVVLPLVRAHLPGAHLDARRRELVAEAVAEGAGRDDLARLHRRWLAVLGPPELTEADDEMVAWAAGAAEARAAGRPFDLGDLPADTDPGAGRTIAALVVHGVAAAAAATAAESLVDRATGRSSRDPWAALGDLMAVAVGVPVVLPTVVASSIVDLLGRLAPDPAPIEVGPDPNLLTQLLAETLPTWLGSAWGRTFVGRLPVVVPVAVRAGRSGATVRVGRGRVVVENGIGDDIWALFDGEVDALLRAGSQSLAREVRSSRPRR